MAKQTKKETSPATDGEVQNKNKTPIEGVDVKAQEEQARKEQEAEAKERVALGYYEYNGRKYTFTASMPNRVNIDGVILSKEEILSNSDVLESMIDSKNIFIKEI
ncbi:hypothetical protein [Myroides fluvii]|uniref:hypothetical protein n=1 Tax=Myroides fluvii TaxID=2572594 RepID=UPI00131C7144|nr:hypothetical protein [Myroides fluvii]